MDLDQYLGYDKVLWGRARRCQESLLNLAKRIRTRKSVVPLLVLYPVECSRVSQCWVLRRLSLEGFLVSYS